MIRVQVLAVNVKLLGQVKVSGQSSRLGFTVEAENRGRMSRVQEQVYAGDVRENVLYSTPDCVTAAVQCYAIDPDVQ